MKKITIFLLFIWAFAANAQNDFQNPGFETWTGSTVKNWNTLSIMGVALSDVSKSSEAYSGNYAIKIAPKQLPPTIASLVGVEKMVVPGLLTNATIDMTAITNALSSGSLDFDNNTLISVFNNGVPLTKRSTSVNGYISWNPIDPIKEQFLLAAYVISNQTGTREVIGMGAYSMLPEAKATYSPFTLSIIYQDEQKTPTELIFISLVTSIDSNANSFGYLLMDDVSITSEEIGLEEISNDTKKLPIIFPNPTSGEFKINVSSDVEISVYNQLGKVIIPEIKYSPNKTLSIKEKGVYFVRIKDSKGVKTQKLIVK